MRRPGVAPIPLDTSTGQGKESSAMRSDEMQATDVEPTPCKRHGEPNDDARHAKRHAKAAA